MKTICLHAILLCLGTFMYDATFAQDTLIRLGKGSIDKVLHAMTLEEKAKLVVGNGFNMPGVPNGTGVGMTEDKVPGAAGTTFAISRLGIPSIVVSDGPAGVRIDPVRKGTSGKTYYATAWPVGTLLASSSGIQHL